MNLCQPQRRSIRLDVDGRYSILFRGRHILEGKYLMALLPQFKDKCAVAVFRTWQVAREHKFCILDPGSLRSKRSRTKRTKYGPRKGVFHIRAAQI